MTNSSAALRSCCDWILNSPHPYSVELRVPHCSLTWCLQLLTCEDGLALVWPCLAFQGRSSGSSYVCLCPRELEIREGMTEPEIRHAWCFGWRVSWSTADWPWAVFRPCTEFLWCRKLLITYLLPLVVCVKFWSACGAAGDSPGLKVMPAACDWMAHHLWLMFWFGSVWSCWWFTWS